MNKIIKKLKLYRIKTVMSYIGDSWKNSEFVLKQAPHKSRIPVYFDLIWCFLKYGADFNDYCTFSFWNKSSKDKDTFITLKRNDKLWMSMSTPRVYSLFLDKAAFNDRFSAWVKRGWISSTRSAFDEILLFLDKYETVIAKPLTDFGGHGVIKISKNDADYRMKVEKLKDRITAGEDYIIEEVIENCANLKRIAPSSLNTIRIVTVIDKDNKLHILASLLRMGNGKAITDNYHDGGMACEIDLNKKCLIGVAKGMFCVKYDEHPLSKIHFDGFSVPEIEKCLDILGEVVYTEPEARYVGWDFAVTSDGVELLEGNIPPGEDITQLNCDRGLWHEMLKYK